MFSPTIVSIALLLCSTTYASVQHRSERGPIEVLGRCVKVVTEASDRCIEDPDIIDSILTHLRKKEQDIPTLPLLAPPFRAPPETLPLFVGEGAR